MIGEKVDTADVTSVSQLQQITPIGSHGKSCVGEDAQDSVLRVQSEDQVRGALICIQGVRETH